MRVALTGASGHIGANLCRRLIARGYNVRALINQFQDSLDGLEIEKINGNLKDLNSLKLLVKDAEVVIHLAANISVRGSSDNELLEINITGTRNILEAVKKNPPRQFIHFSSIHALVQEPFDEILDENRPLALQDSIMYNQTKAISEKYVLEATANGLHGVILNPTSVIGPNDFKPSLMGKAILQIAQKKLPGLVMGGYDWVDARDVAEATINAIEKGKQGERYLLSGSWVSLPELAKIVAEFIGAEHKWKILPYWLAELGVPFLHAYAWLRGTDPLYTHESLEIIKKSHRMISSEKAKQQIGFNPRPVKESIFDTLSWFREHGYLNL